MHQSEFAPSHMCVCTPLTCDALCALQVIDGLLRERQHVTGEQVDALLDLRSLLRRGEEAGAALALFCRLRRAMEQSHYLAFYRLRRWFENHIEAQVRVCRGRPEIPVPVKMNRFCVEAIRFECLKAAVQPGQLLLAPRVTFRFCDAGVLALSTAATKQFA